VRNQPWYDKWVSTLENPDYRKKCAIKIDQWEKEYKKARGKKKERLSNKKVTPTKCISEYTHVTRVGDPFNVRNLTSFTTRYAATLALTFYPDDQTFHLRGLHYRLQAQPIAWFKGKKGNKYVTRYGGNPDDPNYFKVNNEHYNDLIRGIKLARFAKLIPMEKVIEKRITTGVQPATPGILPEITRKTFTPHIHAEITPVKDFEIQVSIPIIVLFSEKGELQPIFEELTKRYFISYYIAAGEISVTAAKDIYQYIKNHARNAIILTFTDADRSGISIPVNIARKIQWFIEQDQRDSPGIIVYPLAVNEQQVAEMKKLGIRPVTKQYKGKSPETINAYELDALDALAAKEGVSLFNYIDMELRKLLPLVLHKAGAGCEEWEGSLLPRSTLDNHYDVEFKALQSLLKKNLDETVQKLKKEITESKGAESARKAFEMIGAYENIDQYSQQLLTHIKQMPAFTALEQAAAITSFDPCDIHVKTPAFNPKIDLNAEALIPPALQLEFPELTKHLNDLRKQKKAMMWEPTLSEIKALKEEEHFASPYGTGIKIKLKKT